MHARSAGARGSASREMRFRTAEHVVSTQQADATVLLDIRGGTYYTLNDVGGRIWACLSEGASVGGVVERLAAEFDVPAETLSGDVAEFVEELGRSKLVTAC